MRDRSDFRERESHLLRKLVSGSRASDPEDFYPSNLKESLSFQKEYRHYDTSRLVSRTLEAYGKILIKH